MDTGIKVKVDPTQAKKGADEVAKAMEKIRKASQDADAAIRRSQRTMAEGRRVTQQMRTPTEAYNASVQRLQRLMQAGAINQMTYNRALVAARREMLEAMGATERFGRAVGGLRGIFAVVGIAAFSKSVLDATVRFDKLMMVMRTAMGSSEAAAAEISHVARNSRELGIDLVSTAQSYAKFMAATRDTRLEGEKAREIFEAVTLASRAVGLSADDTAGTLRALEQMISKGNVQAEELRGQLGDRLPGAFRLAAKAMGVTTAELNEMLKKGEVSAEEMLPKLARELRNAFGDDAIAASKSLNAQMERLNTQWQNLLTSMGGTLPIQKGASLVEQFIGGWAVIFGNALDPADALNQRILDLTEKLERLKNPKNGVEAQNDFLFGRDAKARATEIATLTAELQRLQAQQERMQGTGLAGADKKEDIDKRLKKKGLGETMSLDGMYAFVQEGDKIVQKAVGDWEEMLIEMENDLNKAFTDSGAQAFTEWGESLDDVIKRENDRFAGVGKEAKEALRQELALDEMYQEMEESTRTSLDNMLHDLEEFRTNVSLAQLGGFIDTDEASARLREFYREMSSGTASSLDQQKLMWQEYTDEINFLIEQNIITFEEGQRRMQMKVGPFSDYISSAFEDVENLGVRTWTSIADGIADMAARGKASFRELAQSIIADIIRVQIRAAAAQIFAAMFNSGSAQGFGAGGYSGTPYGQIGTGPVRYGATGGSYRKGTPLVTGEKGPEFQFTKQDMMVLSNRDSRSLTERLIQVLTQEGMRGYRGGEGGNITVNNHMPMQVIQQGNSDPTEMEERMGRMMEYNRRATIAEVQRRNRKGRL